MNCLSSEQLIALTLADALADDLTAEQSHVGECADCAARLTQIQECFLQLEKAMAWFDRDHAAERNRLLESLAEIKPAPQRTSVTRTLTEVLTMPRTWIGGAAAAVLVVAFFFLSGGSPSLIAQTAEALREVRSYHCRVTVTTPSPDGTKTETTTMKMYWAAPGSIRTDTHKGEKLAEVRILPKDKPGVEIDHSAETFSRLDPAQGSLSPLLALDKLAHYSGRADRTLEKRQINNVAAPGFEISLRKIDPDVGDGALSVWIDPKTKLPLRVEGTMGSFGKMVWDEFQWNLPSEKWFTLEPPASYQDKTPTPPDVEKITQDIITGLKTYAKYCGGKYPQVTKVYGDVTSEELNVAAGLPPRSPPKDIGSNVYGECLRASLGFAQINTLQRHSRDAAYHGKTVGPQDKGKVLFRWKLNDGRFRVIFGDLHVEDVSEARLKELEAN